MTSLVIGCGAARRRRRASDGVEAGVPYVLPSAPPWNAPQRAIVPTYDGSGDAVHPSVLDFQQINAGTWRGWRYWMVFTPYPGNDNAYENPSIVVSSDGYTWVVPDGLTNPIYPKPTPGPGESVAWNNDPTIEYDPATDEIVLVYVASRTGNPPNVMARSADGVTWPTAPTPLNVTTGQAGGTPSLIKVGATWHLYWAAAGVGGNVLMRSRSTDLVTWTNDGMVIDGGPLAMSHCSVAHFHGRFWAVIDRGSEWQGRPDGLRAASSTNGLTWTVAADDFMDLDPAHPWESAELYRTCITPHEDGHHARVWYSSQGPLSRWSISYTRVRLDAWPAPPA